MITFGHISSLSLLNKLENHPIELIIPGDCFAYRKPTILSRTDFETLYLRAIELGYHPYIELNGFVMPEELVRLSEYLDWLLKFKPKGFYINDLAVLMSLKEKNFQGELVYCPDTLLTNHYEASVFLKDFKRVQLAKELTLDEYRLITHNLPQKCEMFALGHLIMSVSKRPLLSSYFEYIQDQRSVLNDLNYRLVESKRSDSMPILEEQDTTSIYMDGIFTMFEAIPSLKDDLYGIHLDPLFIPEDAFIDLLDLVLKVEKDGYDEKAFKLIKQRYPSLKWNDGYLNRSTNASKEV